MEVILRNQQSPYTVPSLIVHRHLHQAFRTHAVLIQRLDLGQALPHRAEHCYRKQTGAKEKATQGSDLVKTQQGLHGACAAFPALEWGDGDGAQSRCCGLYSIQKD